MAKRKTCPRKGSTFLVAGSRPVIATGDCTHDKVNVATMDSGVVALSRDSLTVTRGKKREEARNALRASGNPIAAWLAGSPKPMKTTKASKASRSSSARLLPSAAEGGVMVPRWDPSEAKMRWVVIPASQVNKSELPEAWQYMHAGEASAPAPLVTGSSKFFDGLSGIGDLGFAPAEHLSRAMKRLKKLDEYLEGAEMNRDVEECRDTVSMMNEVEGIRGEIKAERIAAKGSGNEFDARELQEAMLDVDNRIGEMRAWVDKKCLLKRPSAGDAAAPWYKRVFKRG